jgi:5-methylthioadenosine/S-adenosylhomocysteine deaminase
MDSILIKNGTLLTMKGEGVGTIEDGAVYIEGKNIISVGKSSHIARKHSNAKDIIDAKDRVVLPGFIDGHIHTGHTLMRGEAQDVPEIEWMLKTIAPFTKYISPRHASKAAALGVLEAVKAGTTTFGEIGGNMNPIAEKVYIPSGVRANIANTINEIGPESRPDAHQPYVFFEDIGEKKLKEAIELVEKFDGAGEGRISCIFSPHGADMMSKELLIRVKEKAAEYNKLSHIHVAQGGREEIQMKLRYGTTTIKFLDSIGYLDNQVIAAHCHQTTDDEVALLAERGVRYASCPSSIGLIDGITPPLGLFIRSGGKWATIGSDQASGNNHHNMLVEMKVAALLNKTRHKDPTILPAWKMLRLATIEGATTLGLGGRIGSIEEGKIADLILINLKVPHMTPVIMRPVRNIAPNIVYSARGDEITDVMINGKRIIENGKILTMNEEKIIYEAQKAAEEVCDKAVDDYMNANSVLAKAVKKNLL